MYSIRQTTRNISDVRVRVPVRVLPHPRVDKQEENHTKYFRTYYIIFMAWLPYGIRYTVYGLIRPLFGGFYEWAVYQLHSARYNFTR